LPVIGHESSPGPREIIKNGKNGFLINDKKDLVKILLNFDRKKINKLRKNCIKNSKNYSFHNSYIKFKSILSKINPKVVD
jgi:glycosyltransferase involved in cell wall biosynthesis